jgi:plasmid stability protein
MLRPTQQRLPESVTKALEDAAAAWERSDAEEARKCLVDALTQAEERGYL